MSCLAQPVESVFNKSKKFEENSETFSENPSQTQESNKINGVQFRLRMTKNQHKRENYSNCHSSKLNSMNRLTVERGSENLSDHSSKSQKSKKNKPSRKPTPNDRELIQTALKTRTTVSAN